MDSNKILEQLNLSCHRGYDTKLQTGTGGNVSARKDENSMYVKASGSSFGDSEVSGFVETDLYGNKIAGVGNPTREAFLHGLIYRYYPKVNAVFHSHSPYSIALSATYNIIPKVTWHAKLKIKGEIPVIDVPSAMVREEDESTITEFFSQYPELTGFVLKNHGIVVLGEDPLKAEHMAELFEETSQIVLFQNLLEKKYNG